MPPLYFTSSMAHPSGDELLEKPNACVSRIGILTGAKPL